MPGDADSHRYFEDLAVAHVVGGLDESDGRIFRAHLLDCADCRARVWELRALAHELADVERDERRERAAKVLETKQRDEDGGDEASREQERAGPSQRTPRVLLLVGFALLLLLTAWNFTMRGTVSRQDQIIEGLQAGSAALAFGERGAVVRSADNVQGSLLVHQGSFALVVEGLDSEQAHGIYLLDSAGDVLIDRTERPTQRRLFVTMRLEPGTERVVVTRLNNGPSSAPTGLRVFEASVSGS